MKRIKIILGIISVLVVIFFATGSFIKETSYTASIKINKPLESVFKEFNDMEMWNEQSDRIPYLKNINETLRSLPVIRLNHIITKCQKNK